MAFFNENVESIVKKIIKKELKSVDIVSDSLNRIKKDKTNSFISVFEEYAIKRAEYLDSLSMEEKNNMPLCGIPIAVKDNICTTEGRTTCGSRMLENFESPYNADVVEKLEAAGAVIVGKTNMDEFAMGSTNETSYMGAVKNPVNGEFVPGGSSGGSAAAVGADLVPLALGSDTGGSIRLPASHCGVVGLKPTYGRVSRYGLVAFASSLDQIGVFAHNVDDAELLLSVISGEDNRDSTCAGNKYEYRSGIKLQDLNGWKIGVPKEYFGEGLNPDIKNIVENKIKDLEKVGADIVEVSIPSLEYAVATYYIICTAEASSNLARYDGVKYGYRVENAKSLKDMYTHTRHNGFGDEVKRRIMLGTYVLSSGYYDAYYLKAAKVRTIISRDFEKAFEKCDLLISPVSPDKPFRLGEKLDDPLQLYLSDIYTVSANLAGIPAISIPAGKVDGLPVGVQLWAQKWNEEKLFRAGDIIESITK